MDPHDADALIIPVNFVPSDPDDGPDFILSALIGIPRRLFLSAHLWGSPVGRVHDLSIQVLEIGRVSDEPFFTNFYPTSVYGLFGILFITYTRVTNFWHIFGSQGRFIQYSTVSVGEMRN